MSRMMIKDIHKMNLLMQGSECQHISQKVTVVLINPEIS